MLTKADIQRLRSLREKKHREALGLFAVEGPKVVRELLAAGHAFAEIYATDAWDGPCTARITAAEILSFATNHLDHHLKFLYGKRAAMGVTIYPRYSCVEEG